MPNENSNFEKQIKDEVKDLKASFQQEGVEIKGSKLSNIDSKDVDRLEQNNDAMRATLLAQTSNLIQKIEQYGIDKGELSGEMKKIHEDLQNLQKKLQERETPEEIEDVRRTRKQSPREKFEEQNASWKLKIFTDRLARKLPSGSFLDPVSPDEFSVYLGGSPFIVKVDTIAGKQKIVISQYYKDGFSNSDGKLFITDENGDLDALVKNLVDYGASIREDNSKIVNYSEMKERLMHETGMYIDRGGRMYEDGTLRFNDLSDNTLPKLDANFQQLQKELSSNNHDSFSYRRNMSNLNEIYNDLKQQTKEVLAARKYTEVKEKLNQTVRDTVRDFTEQGSALKHEFMNAYRDAEKQKAYDDKIKSGPGKVFQIANHNHAYVNDFFPVDRDVLNAPFPQSLVRVPEIGKWVSLAKCVEADHPPGNSSDPLSRMGNEETPGYLGQYLKNNNMYFYTDGNNLYRAEIDKNSDAMNFYQKYNPTTRVFENFVPDDKESKVKENLQRRGFFGGYEQ